MNFPNLPISPVVLVILSIWSLAWKGFALWRAARLSQQNWYIAMLVLNSAGLLEIVYLFWFSKEPVRFDFSDLFGGPSKKKKK